jgi:hypothetical protein
MAKPPAKVEAGTELAARSCAAALKSHGVPDLKARSAR